jgi:hypothetical protein
VTSKDLANLDFRNRVGTAVAIIGIPLINAMFGFILISFAATTTVASVVILGVLCPLFTWVAWQALVETRVRVTETEMLVNYPFAVRRVPIGHVDSVSIRVGDLVIETRNHQVIKPATFRASLGGAFIGHRLARDVSRQLDERVRKAQPEACVEHHALEANLRPSVLVLSIVIQAACIVIGLLR